MHETLSSAPGRTGDDVLDWLRTPDARAATRRLLRQRGLHVTPELIDDTLADAAVAVLKRMAGPTPLAVENPGGYGTRVLTSVIRLLVRGRDAPLDDEAEIAEALPTSALDPTAGDDLRVALETLPTTAPWQASATLTYLVYLMHPDVVPADAPSPKAGSGHRTARCWPALWFAGQRGLFPGDDGDPPARRRTRARRIEAVLARFDDAVVRVRMDLGGSR